MIIIVKNHHGHHYGKGTMSNKNKNKRRKMLMISRNIISYLNGNITTNKIKINKCMQ